MVPRLTPVTLEGRLVRLEPLTLEALPDLWPVARDPDLWRWTLADIRTPADLRSYVEDALAAQAQGSALPFVIRCQTDGQAIGSTRYANVEPVHRKLEIGWTWVGRAWQRTGVNRECKRLLLDHAFRVLGCGRVEFKTDALNAQSRRALVGIGAVEEGTLRAHQITATGRVRDSVYYSILASEWPAVQARLEGRRA
jgi:RimJ/RimL family protein N-acetyltransferase